MKPIIRTVAVAAVSAAALGAAADGAHALSLGPAGTVVAGEGRIGNSGSLYYGLSFSDSRGATSGITVDCTSTSSRGTLDGGASVRLSTTYTGCQAKRGFSPGTPIGPATVSAPGGHVLTLTSATQRQDGTYYGRGVLTSGAGGVTVTVGSCTLAIPANRSLITTPQGQVHIQANSAVAIHPVLRYATVPFTGSAGCPADLQGTRTTGAGLSYWFSRLEGLRVIP